MCLAFPTAAVRAHTHNKSFTAWCRRQRKQHQQRRKRQRLPRRRTMARSRRSPRRRKSRKHEAAMQRYPPGLSHAVRLLHGQQRGDLQQLAAVRCRRMQLLFARWCLRLVSAVPASDGVAHVHRNAFTAHSVRAQRVQAACREGHMAARVTSICFAGNGSASWCALTSGTCLASASDGCCDDTKPDAVPALFVQDHIRVSHASTPAQHAGTRHSFVCNHLLGWYIAPSIVRSVQT